MVLAFGSFLILLCLGVVEFGKLIYWSIEVANAAKAGAQYAAQTSTTAVDPTGTGIQNAAAAAATDLTGLTASHTLWCACTITGSYSSPTISGSVVDCTGTTCSGPVHLAVTVTTSATVTPPYKLSMFSSSYTLHGSATQECVQ